MPAAAKARRACTCGAEHASIREILRGDGTRPEGYIVRAGRIMHGDKCEAIAQELERDVDGPGRCPTCGADVDPIEEDKDGRAWCLNPRCARLVRPTK